MLHRSALLSSPRHSAGPTPGRNSEWMTSHRCTTRRSLPSWTGQSRSGRYGASAGRHSRGLTTTVEWLSAFRGDSSSSRCEPTSWLPLPAAATSAAASAGSADVSEHAAALAATTAGAADTAKSTWITQRRVYRDLQRQTRKAYWRSKVTADGTSPRQLWCSIDELLGRGHVPTSSAIGADEFHKFFDAKVASVRASTDGAPPPSFTTALPNCILGGFRPLTEDEVIAATRQLLDKQCMSDPMTTHLLNLLSVQFPVGKCLQKRSIQNSGLTIWVKHIYRTPLTKLICHQFHHYCLF